MARTCCCPGGVIVAMTGIAEAYQTGRGPITLRGRAAIEGDEASPADGGARRAPKRTGSSKPIIVITELPFQTNKAGLVEHVAKLTDDGVLQGSIPLRGSWILLSSKSPKASSSFCN